MLLLMDQGDAAGNRAVIQQLIDSGHAIGAPAARVTLAGRGDADAAAYQQAVKSTAAPRAMVVLGGMLALMGEVTWAEACYRQAIDSGDAHVLPRATAGLEKLRTQRTDTPGSPTTRDLAHGEQNDRDNTSRT